MPTTTRSATSATRRSSACGRRPPTRQLAALNDTFGQLVSSGRIERTGPLPVEVRHADRLEMARIRFQFAKHKYGDLRAMIDVLNSFAPTSSG